MTSSQLREMVFRHLDFEVQMLNRATKKWALVEQELRNKLKTPSSPPSNSLIYSSNTLSFSQTVDDLNSAGWKTSYIPPLDKVFEYDWPIEIFLLHARNLMDFFFELGMELNDDVFAKHLFKQAYSWAKPDWPNAVDWKRDINKRLSHITEKRLCKEIDWGARRHEILKKLGEALSLLKSASKKGEILDGVSEALLGLPEIDLA